MVYYVYIIKSTLKDWYYVGITKDVDNRFFQHNKGWVKSTKHYKPFKLFFVQIVKSINIARDLEKYLKIRFNKESLINLVSS